MRRLRVSADRGAAPVESGVGSADDLVPVRGGAGGAVAGQVVDLSMPHSATLYVCLAYTVGVETKTERWTLRVTPAQDAAVRRVLESTGESLNEYVVRHAVEAAHIDLADRRVFAVDDVAWSTLQEILDRPAVRKPDLARLLSEPSVLETGRR